MKVNRQIIFWGISIIILVLLFSRSLGGFTLSLFFVTFLFPVVFSTSFFFNYYLVPKYLMAGKKLKFGLYFSYMLIVSIYLELLVMILAFVILADYQVDNLGKIASDIYLLTIILYLIVFANGFMEVYLSLKRKEQQIHEIEQKKALEDQGFLLLKVDRKNVRVALKDILFIESLSDYVKVHTVTESYLTKDKISAMEQSLPDYFIRIHRSFLINKHQVETFSREEVSIGSQTLTIGRKYKNEALSTLEAGITVDSTRSH